MSHPANLNVVPVSCYIRALNEERRIGAVIASVRDLVEEVVVVDSGSTDATVAIAEALGARIIRQAWLGNGRQKRFAEDHCRNDFLLDLDADEVVSPELAEEIRALFAHGEPPRPIYQLPLVTVPPVGEPWYDIGVRRRRKLYDRRVVRQPDHKAWDQFTVPPGITCGLLTGPLLHYAFGDLAHVVAKLNRASTVRATETRRRTKAEVALRVLFALPVYFLKHYLQRGLFRAGVYGVSLAAISAFGRWLRDAKMYEQILASEARAAAQGHAAGQAALDPLPQDVQLGQQR
jgi:glycosyltransferase involved in cell wall biosynthesis